MREMVDSSNTIDEERAIFYHHEELFARDERVDAPTARVERQDRIKIGWNDPTSTTNFTANTKNATFDNGDSTGTDTENNSSGSTTTNSTTEMTEGEISNDMFLNISFDGELPGILPPDTNETEYPSPSPTVVPTASPTAAPTEPTPTLISCDQNEDLSSEEQEKEEKSSYDSTMELTYVYSMEVLAGYDIDSVIADLEVQMNQLLALGLLSCRKNIQMQQQQQQQQELLRNGNRRRQRRKRRRTIVRTPQTLHFQGKEGEEEEEDISIKDIQHHDENDEENRSKKDHDVVVVEDDHSGLPSKLLSRYYLRRVLRKKDLFNSPDIGPHQKYLGVVAIDSKPDDKPSSLSLCSPVVDESDSCTVVHSAMTMYLKNNSDLAAVRYATRSSVMEFMANGTLVGSVTGLVRATYRGPTLNGEEGTDENTGVPNSEGENRNNNDGGDGSVLTISEIIAVAAVSAAVVALVLLTAFLLQARRKRRNACEEGEESPSNTNCCRDDKLGVVGAIPSGSFTLSGSWGTNGSDEEPEIMDNHLLPIPIQSRDLSTILEIDERSSVEPSVIISEGWASDDDSVVGTRSTRSDDIDVVDTSLPVLGAREMS